MKNGLNSILSAIKEEAEQRASENVTAAQSDKAVMISEADEELEKLEKESKEKTKKDAEILLARTQASNEQYLKQQLMLTKKKFIDEVIKAAQDKIESMSDKNYFEFMAKLVEANAHNDDGAIVFGEKDMKRLPGSFVEDCSKKLKKGSLKLDDKSADTAKIKSGFIIRYGDVEENCTLDSIFTFRYDELSDIVSEFLSEQV